MKTNFVDMDLGMGKADKRAWSAVLSCNLGALDAALGHGANPNCCHPLGHSLIDQAVKSRTKASPMCAILIERGAVVPLPDSPLAFELASRAIFEDSPILARQLMASSAQWPGYLKDQRDLMSLEDPQNPSKLQTYMLALSASQAIGQFNQQLSTKRSPGASLRAGC